MKPPGNTKTRRHEGSRRTSSQDSSNKSVFQKRHVEIHQQADPQLRNAQVAEQLGAMYRSDRFDRFDREYEGVRNDKIQPLLTEQFPSIDHGIRPFALKGTRRGRQLEPK